MCSTSLFVFNFKYGYDINASTSSFKELFKEFIDLFLPYFKLICLVAYSLCILKTASDIVEDEDVDNADSADNNEDNNNEEDA